MANEQTWIVVGSSPNAPEMLPVARAEYPDAIVITSNRAGELFAGGDLDYYFFANFISDKVHNNRFLATARRLKQCGTKLITLDGVFGSKESCGTQDFDDFLSLDSRHLQTACAVGGYANCGYSGLHITAFALNHGATRIAWVGMEGYRSRPGCIERDHFDGDQGWAEQAKWIQEIYGPMMRSFPAAYPQVDFVMYGTPNYEIDGPSVQIKEPVSIGG